MTSEITAATLLDGGDMSREKNIGQKRNGLGNDENRLK